MRKKIARIVLAVLTVCILLTVVGCNTEDDGPMIPVSFEEGTEIHPQGKIKATTYLRSGKDSEIAFDNWIKEYNKVYPDVVIKPDIINWSDLATKIAAGDIGDVYYGCEQDVYGYAIKHRAAMPLDAYVELLDIDISDVFTGLYELGCANGYLYMVPSDINPGVLYVNVTALTEAGIDFPDVSWTYEDFKEICKAVTKTNADGTYEQVAMTYGTDFPGIMRFMVGFGGNWCDQVNKKVHFVSDENCLKGVEELINLIDSGYIKVNGLTGEVGARFANITNASNQAFVGGTFISRITMAEEFETLGLEMNVINYPEFPHRVIVGGATGFFVYSKTKNADAAATFCLFMLDDAGQRAFNSTLGGGIPTTKSNYEDTFWRFPLEEEKFNYDAFIVYPEAFIGNWPEVYTPPEIAAELSAFASTFYSRHFNNVKNYVDLLGEIEEKVNEMWGNLFD